MPVKTKPISMSMAPSRDYLQGWNDCHKHMAEEIVRQDGVLDRIREAAFHPLFNSLESVATIKTILTLG